MHVLGVKQAANLVIIERVDRWRQATHYTWKYIDRICLLWLVLIGTFNIAQKLLEIRILSISDNCQKDEM